MIAEVLLIKNENRYLLEYKKCRLLQAAFFIVARETLWLVELGDIVPKGLNSFGMIDAAWDSDKYFPLHQVMIQQVVTQMVMGGCHTDKRIGEIGGA